MKMKTPLIIIALLRLSGIAHAGEASNPDFKIEYNSSSLTVITVESNKLNCTWHTLRKDLNAERASLESYDKHQSSITLIPSEANELHQWAHAAIKTKVTVDQKKSRRGYSTVLSLTVDGQKYNPNHDTIDGFKEIVSKIIKERRKEEFNQPVVPTGARADWHTGDVGK